MRNGELASDFAEVAPVICAEGSPGSRPALRSLRRVGLDNEEHLRSSRTGPLPERALRSAALAAVRRSLRRELYRHGAPDLVYLNTVDSGAALSLVAADTPVMTHVHELSFQLRLQRQVEPSAVAQIVSRTSRYVAASRAVAEALTDVYGVDPRRVDVCHEFIPISDLPLEGGVPNDLRGELGASPGSLLVGSIGTIEWRKGADLFIQVAKRVIDTCSDRQDVRFAWVGPALDRSWKEAVRHDLEALGIAERVRFIGPVDDPAPLIADMDVFVLTSRSDAFPVSCLEAAARGKPLICFNAGGMTEFLMPDDHLLVPYLDVDAMAARISELLDSCGERQRLGDRLRLRVRERHRLESSAPILLGHIEREIRRGEAPAGRQSTAEAGLQSSRP